MKTMLPLTNYGSPMSGCVGLVAWLNSGMVQQCVIAVLTTK